MNRGRKPTPNPQRIDDGVDAKALAELNEAGHQLTAAHQLAMEQGELHRLVGRIEAAHFLETVSSRIIVESYVQARTAIGKLGSMTVQCRDGSTKRVSCLEDFCDAVMPVSHRRCQQLAQAMHTLGPALFEQAESMGLGHRNYQAIRALPNDMQEEVKTAIASGDREQTLTLLEELAARNAALKAENSKLEKDKAAKDDLIARKDQKINELVEADHRRTQGTPNEREQAQIQALNDAVASLETKYLQFAVVLDDAKARPATAAAALAAQHALDVVVQRLSDLMAQLNLTTSWGVGVAADAANLSETLGKTYEPVVAQPIGRGGKARRS